MAVAKVRQGGAWVESNLAGKVRVGGAWASFGPADGEQPQPESLFTTQVPTNPGFVESSSTLMLGTVINVQADGQISGGRWLFPTTIPTGMVAQFVLYDNMTGVELRRATFTAPAAGAWNEVAFAPYAVASGASLVAAVYLSGGAQVGYPSSPFMFDSAVASGNLFAPASANEPRSLGNGRFASANVFPNASFNRTCYFVDLVFEKVSASTGSVLLTGPDRPVMPGQTVVLDVVATNLTAGETITSYDWTITSGGGSVSSKTSATPTFTAPSGTGATVVRAAIGTSRGRAGFVDVRVSYAQNIVAAENALPGTARVTWDLPVGELGGVSTLQGFCDGFTANKDEVVNFKIAQADTAAWSADVYRLGWYGGSGARYYGTLTPTPTQVSASRSQPTPTDVDPNTVLPSLDCGNWATTLSWTPPAWAPSGMYVLRLNHSGGGASHVLFALRDDDRTADLMFMPADSTWQAYNAFGGLGSDLYGGNSLYYGTSVMQYDNDAARFVSHNRPIVNRGAADPGRVYGAVEWSTFFTGEYPMLRFLERNGFDLKVYGCIDAAGDPTGAKLSTVKAAMAVGHNEYWSDGMRAGWEAAKAAGTNLFFCAGNEVFWRLVGSAPDADGRPRTWECFKSTIASRGSTGREQWTGTWRDPDGAGKGGDAPENTLTGTIFVVNGPDLRSLAVPFDGGYSAQPIWRHTPVAALTAGQLWTSPDQILGFEWDTYGPEGVEGPGAAFLADPHPQARFCSDSTYLIPSGVLLTDAGDEYTQAGNATHRLVVHPGGNNGLVFGTGTVNWALGCDNANAYQIGSDNTTPVIQQATVNMLVDMGCAPRTLMAGLTVPAKVLWYGGVDPGEPESYTFQDTPAGGPDFADNPIMLGTQFSVATAGSWVGVRVWVTPTPPSFAPSVAAYDSTTRLAVKQYVEPVTRGQYTDVLFDAPVAVVPGVVYQAAIHTDRYGFTAKTALPLPLQSASGRLVSDGEVSLFKPADEPSVTPPELPANNYGHMAPIVAFP